MPNLNVCWKEYA